MSRPTPLVLNATTAEKTEDVGLSPGRLSAIQIKNDVFGRNVLVDFDADISANSYSLEVGEVLTIEYPFFRLHYKTDSGTSTLRVIRINQ